MDIFFIPRKKSLGDSVGREEHRDLEACNIKTSNLIFPIVFLNLSKRGWDKTTFTKKVVPLSIILIEI